MAVNPSAKSNYLSKVQLNGGTYWVKDAELRELLNSAATKEAIESIITDGADANNTNSTIPTTLALTTWLEQKIAGLTDAMHFAGVTDPEAGETPEARIAAKVPNPAAGDIVIDGTAEYVYDGTEWKPLGDEGTYATRAQLETAVSGITIGGTALGNDHAITAQELITALGLKALAFKDSASGSVETVDSGKVTIPEATLTLSGTAISVPKTFNALDVTPAGSVALTQDTNAAATYDKASSVAVPTVASVSYDKVDSDVAVTAAAPGQGESANYTPAGTITLPSFTASLNLAEDSVATVTDAGTAYTLSGGSVAQAADSTSAFATEGVTAHMASGAEITGDVDAETLVFSAAGTTNAVTASGAVTFTTPTLSGHLPTFSTKDVVIKTGSTASAAASGDATFTGTGVLLSGTATASTAQATITPGTQNVIPTYETANATMTQPAFSAAFTGTGKSVTPTVATSENAAPADATAAVAAQTITVDFVKSNKAVTVS